MESRQARRKEGVELFIVALTVSKMPLKSDHRKMMKKIMAL